MAALFDDRVGVPWYDLNRPDQGHNQGLVAPHGPYDQLRQEEFTEDQLEMIRNNKYMFFPDRYWFLEGEADEDELAQGTLNQQVIAVMKTCFYETNAYRYPNIDDFVHRVQRRQDVTRELCIYFYNRQQPLVIYMKPKEFPWVNKPAIPLQHPPFGEIQADVVYLNERYQEYNYNIRHIIYLVDPYTRFVWAYPTQQLTSEKIQEAMILALSRPGVSNDAYTKMRTSVRKFVVDGGSEFKKHFPHTLALLFPHTKIMMARPKHQMNSKPSLTGSLENSVRGFKKRLQRYMDIHVSGVRRREGLRVLDNKMEGLENVLEEYNNEPRTSLGKLSPTEVMETLLEDAQGDQQVIQEQQELMERIQEFETKKKQKNLTTRTRTLLNFPGVTQNGYFDSKNNYYRIYVSPSPFTKETDITMSTDLYRVLEVVFPNMALLECVTNVLDKQQKSFHELVLVKGPEIQDCPHIKNEMFYKRSAFGEEVERVPLGLRQNNLPYPINVNVTQVIQEIRQRQGGRRNQHEREILRRIENPHVFAAIRPQRNRRPNARNQI